MAGMISKAYHKSAFVTNNSNHLQSVFGLPEYKSDKTNDITDLKLNLNAKLVNRALKQRE